MKATELAAKAKDIAQNYKTCYIWGGIGLPVTVTTIQRAVNQYSKNEKYAPAARKLAGQPRAFYFDCVGLVKSLLWGWVGDSSKTYGGATYASNGVPDIGADTMITKCSGISTDFSDIQVGEVVWTTGHIGIYIGDGLAVESTPAWKNGVQITAVRNIGTKSGYNARTWKKHGKLPYVTYDAVSAPKPTEAAKVKIDPAYKFDKSMARTYTVTASALNLRAGAGTNKAIIKVLPKGSKVTCYGYYNLKASTYWLYVADQTGEVGYCSKKHLS